MTDDDDLVKLAREIAKWCTCDAYQERDSQAIRAGKHHEGQS